MAVVKDNSGAVKAACSNQINAAMQKIGMAAERYAKIACPVDTGRLRNSISFTTGDKEVYIGTDVEYAPYVEMGTVNTSAQPFLKPTITEHMNEYKTILEQELKQ